MHYRHHFHAANFADVFKHSLLTGALCAISRKPAPWCLIETHSGAGRYRLDGAQAEQSPEWREGLGRIWSRQDAPEMVADYLRIVRALQDGPAGPSAPTVYPGSPLIAAALARDVDRLVFCERVAEVAEELRDALAPYRNTVVHLRNGYEAAALLPPAERRGLVLIDPPFEHPDEFGLVADFVAAARQRFAHGVYMIWYPLKKRFDAGRFVRRVAREAGAEVLNLEFTVAAPAEGRMQACGVLFVNPPYGFDAQCEPALQWLVAHLGRGPAAGYTLERLAPQSQ